MKDFIVGRYEAGVGTLNKEKEKNGVSNPFDYTVTFEGGVSLFNSVGVQPKLSNNAWDWQNYNFTAKRQGIPVTNVTNKATGNVVVKADSIPYYHADYYTASEMSRRLYSGHKYVRSGLITGTMWDVMLKYMQDNGINITSPNWGNYYDISLTDLTGYYTNINSDSTSSSYGSTDGFKSARALTTNTRVDTWVLLTTGSTETVKRMNLYDISGNLWEWTVETSYRANYNFEKGGNTISCMLRGGSLNDSHIKLPTCYRIDSIASGASTDFGFRVALFLQ